MKNLHHGAPYMQINYGIVNDMTNLQSTNSSRLETKIRLEILSNFTNETLEWQLADQQFS